ncbi:nicotinate-nucleotide adenylyltransferase [Lentibacillus halophilus]|uniref:Probable nicotinate-nucleotide adenylyltransferase n=1 Tax=Lentibacillus halophilus TaxID=295065 RepID=A0ABP3J5J3_9BACI
MKYVGLLGGTFDPPHIGHLIVAQEVRETLGLDEVWFMPSQQPPHKQRAAAKAPDRAEMVRRAIAGNGYFHISTVEMDRTGKSFTYDTIILLMEKHPNVCFYFVIGADMVEYLPNWKHIDKLMEMVQFVGVKRNGFNIKSTYTVTEVDTPLINISSTDIKMRIGRGQSIRYLVPEGVKNYIKENHLYEER